MTTQFRGVVAARGVLLDVPTIGSDEARRRVLDQWHSGCELRLLPDGRWLLVFDDTRELRIERAIGLPIVESGGGLAAPGLAGEPGRVTWLQNGTTQSGQLSEFPDVPLPGWFDLIDLVERRLTPLDRAADRPAALVEAEVPHPDLRRAAGLGSAKTPRLGRLGSNSPRRRIPRLVIAAAVVVLTALGIAVTIRLVGASGSRSTDDAHPSPSSAATTSTSPVLPGPSLGIDFTDPALPIPLPTGGVLPSPPDDGDSSSAPVPWALVGLIGWLLLMVFTRSRSSLRRRTSAAQTRRRPFGRLISKTPAKDLVRRRHERYVRSLTAKFERGDWHDALTQAISLGSSEHGWLRLRLPVPRKSLSLTSGSGGAGMNLGESARAHLRMLYQNALRQLEKEQRIDEAAYVQAELLNDALGAVDYLERNDRARTAAELAEWRKLPPGLIVRLWWNAGDRARAVNIARARGAFAAGIERLGRVDPGAAAALREEWVRDRQAAGDAVGAVEAAWPESTLRRLVRGELETGAAQDGALGAQLLAYLIADSPSGPAVDRACSLLASRTVTGRSEREQFTATWTQLTPVDVSVDRRISTAAVRALVSAPSDAAVRRQVHHLRRRADPLVRADLPRLRPPVGQTPIDATAPASPGQLPVFDAVNLPDHGVLVAHGSAGVRLLDLDGRTRARWDIPTHKLVVADSSTTALLAREAGDLLDVQRLDLRTRRVSPWHVLRSTHILGSYDGGVAVVIDEDGIAFLDVLGERPRVLWRELDRTHRVLRINRTPGKLTALVSVPEAGPRDQRKLHLFVWELPDITLRIRRPIDLESNPNDAVVFGDEVVFRASSDVAEEILTYRRWTPRSYRRAAKGTTISADGAAFAVTQNHGDSETMTTVDLPDRPSAIQVTSPRSEHATSLREHAGIVTLGDREGRVVVIESTGVLGRFRTSW